MKDIILCDIGNTFLHFYYSGRIWKESPNSITKKNKDISIYYISVNKKSEKKLLDSHSTCINLGPYLELDSHYNGLGLDRKAACIAISEGVIVDAGSAITVDVMQEGSHLGGYILPGVSMYQEMYKKISPVLDTGLNMAVPLDRLPLNTKSAISFGILKSITLLLKQVSCTKRMFFTGGDGKFFAKFFENSIYDNTLVFKGMQKTINKLQQEHN